MYTVKMILQYSKNNVLQCSKDDVAEKLRKNFENAHAVCIANPKTLEFQVITKRVIINCFIDKGNANY